MKVKFGMAVAACGAALVLCSCNTPPAEWEDAWVTQDIVAFPAAAEQIRIDGEISDGEWSEAQEYNLVRAKDWGYERLLPRQRKREDTTPFERGFFKVKYDAENLYVLAVLDDADIVQTANEDQARAIDTGDAVGVLVKPGDKSAVWEFRGTPWGKITTLFYPWAGHSCREQQKFVSGVKVAALAREVTDPEKDKAGWTIELAIPRELIEQTGEVFAPDKDWRILLCRVNYGNDLPSCQISSTPMLPRPNRRLVDYYAKLKFKPAPEDKKASEAKPAAEEKKETEVKPATEEKKEAEVKPAAEKKAPEAKPAAAPTKAEVKPAVAPKTAEAKPVAPQKKAEVKPAAEKKAPVAKPAAAPKKAEAKPVAAEKKAPEVKSGK